MLSNTCPECGKQGNSTDGTCPSCGKALPVSSDKPSKPRKPSIILIIGALFLVMLGGLIVFSMVIQSKPKPAGRFIACQSNLKNIGTALEMYATDNKGHYPQSLQQLSPAYMKNVPTCHAAGSDTYSVTYKSAQNSDAYTFYCDGDHHSVITSQPNYPQYNSKQGLISQP